MKRNSQHITFNDLFAFNDGRLDLNKANQCAKHLETCEDCQNTLEAMQEFDSIELRQPHIEYEEQLLDQELLNITKQHINKLQRNSYVGKLKCHFYKNGWRYLAAVAASLLLIAFFPFTQNDSDPLDAVVDVIGKVEPNHDIALLGDISYALKEKDKCEETPTKLTNLTEVNVAYNRLTQRPEKTRKIDKSIEKKMVVNTTITMDVVPEDMLEYFVNEPVIIHFATHGGGSPLKQESSDQPEGTPIFDLDENLLREKQENITSIDKIIITSIFSSNRLKIDLIITNKPKPDLTLNNEVVKDKAKPREYLRKESNYTHLSNYTHQSNYRMAH